MYALGMGRASAGITAGIIVLLLVAVSAGCAERRFNALMQAWRGHRLAELLSAWGPPRYMYSDGQGGRVLLYIPDSSTAGSRVSPPSSNDEDQADTPRVDYTPQMTSGVPIFRLFFVDARDSIYRAEWRGEWECCSY